MLPWDLSLQKRSRKLYLAEPINMPDFVHLHTHSDYSLLDAISAIPRLVDKAHRLGMPALALTDHGNMFGAIKFYKTCREYGLKPILGSEFYISPGSRFNKTGSEQTVKYYHLILLAKDQEGYHNLMELSSRSYLEGFYYRPRIDEELLLKYNKGLICLTACLAGEIPSLILQDHFEEARRRASFYRDLFGPDNFFLELQYHGIPEQRKVNEKLIELSKALGIKLVATNDIHYIEKAEAKAQEIAICIGTNKKLSEDKRLKFGPAEFYFKTAEEMTAVFVGYEDALRQSLLIAESCHLEIPLPGPELPVYSVPEGYTLESYLESLALHGLTERYENVTTEMMTRLKYELEVINKMGFTGYFLIVWDFIHFAKSQGIPVGPGRGSGAGSLAAYCLGITDIDPLKYGLLFERFLNPERISMPDFDIDFCFARRNEVIDYVTQKYGSERVAQIITFGTLKARAVIRDVARVLDLPYEEADAIAKLIPQGPKIDLNEALKLEPKLEEIRQKSEIHKDLIEVSLSLEGLCRHASTHAAGIVIGKEPLTNYVPLYRDPKTGTITTQFTMEYLEECGLVKMDFLGLKTLTLIKNTLDLLKKRGLQIDLKKIPEDDEKTFKLLSQGKSSCIFQFESSGMQSILKRAKPERIEDLIALNALYRPGPMNNIDIFINGKHNWASIQYPLPELEPILKETYGVIVYQEQVMQIAQRIAGYTLGEADILRRAMGKKKAETMVKEKERFIQGALKNGFKAEVAENLFEMLIPFAGYGFNKSHAAAYSLLAYQTAYLKANYPLEFMAANLSNEIQDTDKLSEYIHEARAMGLTIVPPDVNLSERDFTVNENKIVFGLIGIKNIGEAAVTEILAERAKHGPYQNILDFLSRLNLKTVNKKACEALILAGACDCFGETRATLHHNLERLLAIATQRQEQRSLGPSLFSIEEEEDDFETFKLERIPEWPTLKKLMAERELLGFYFSGHPLDPYRKLIEKYATLNLANKDRLYADDRVHTLVGLLKNIKTIITKNGKRMAFAEIEDLQSKIELVIFSEEFNKFENLLNENEIVAVKGRIDLSRSEPKFLVEEIATPDNLKQTKFTSLHIRLDRSQINEDNTFKLRDLLTEKKGSCQVFFHLAADSRYQAKIIKASNALTVPAEKTLLNQIKEFPQVMEAWFE